MLISYHMVRIVCQTSCLGLCKLMRGIVPFPRSSQVTGKAQTPSLWERSAQGIRGGLQTQPGLSARAASWRNRQELSRHEGIKAFGAGDSMSRQDAWTSSILTGWVVERMMLMLPLNLCWWSPMHWFGESYWEYDFVGEALTSFLCEILRLR